MSLQRLRESFPHEVIPTHYEVRQQVYPSYQTLPSGRQIGVGSPDHVVHGQHDNLLDAMRQQASVELERVNPEHTQQADRLDRFATTLGPSVRGHHILTPHVVAVYPDGSYTYPDHDSSAYYADGTLYTQGSHWQNEEAALTGTLRPPPQAHQPNTQHKPLIHSLAKIGRHMDLAFTHSDAKTLRDRALQDHDPTAALAAADAGEEQGRLDPETAQEVRQHIRDSGVVPYGADGARLVYALNSFLMGTS